MTVGLYRVISSLNEEDIWHRIHGRIRQGLVLRIRQFIKPEDPESYIDTKWDQQERAVRHGGDGGQEIAAILSLLLGIRLKSGGITRIFDAESGSDPLGYPVNPGPIPYLPPPMTNPMLPYLGEGRRSADVQRLSLIERYARLDQKQALALTRAARSYQEAVWIADSDPRQAWLRLVTAAEVIAQLSSSELPLMRLQRTHPDIAKWIENVNNSALALRVTQELHDQSKITAKFLTFFKEYGPSQPKLRPRSQRLNWRNLDRELKEVYKARSKDLHAGIPIPDAMCEAPYVSPRSGAASEMTWVSTTRYGKSTMTLQMFEYLVRDAIIEWWSRSTQTS